MGKQHQAEEEPREDWRDWVPGALPLDESGLLRKADVLAWAEALGLSAGDRTLREWRKAGAIPTPTLTGRGETRAEWYPWWVVDLLQHVRDYQDPARPGGALALAQIGPRQRATAQDLAQRPPLRGKHPPPWPPPRSEGWSPPDGIAPPAWATRTPTARDNNSAWSMVAYADSPYTRALRSYLLVDVTPLPPDDPTTAPQRLSGHMANYLSFAAAMLATRHGAPHGLEIARAELRLIDSHDRAIIFPVPLGEETLPT